jgi:hypothetical protein
VKNEEVLQRVKEERNIMPSVRQNKLHTHIKTTDETIVVNILLKIKM